MQERLATFQTFMAPLLIVHAIVSSEESETERIPVGWPYISKVVRRFVADVLQFWERIATLGKKYKGQGQQVKQKIAGHYLLPFGSSAINTMNL